MSPGLRLQPGGVVAAAGAGADQRRLRRGRGPGAAAERGGRDRGRAARRAAHHRGAGAGPAVVVSTLAQLARLPAIDLETDHPTPEVAELMPTLLARDHQAVAVRVVGKPGGGGVRRATGGGGRPLAR